MKILLMLAILPILNSCSGFTPSVTIQTDENGRIIGTFGGSFTYIPKSKPLGTK